MSRLGGPPRPDEPPPATVVITPKDGPDGQPGELIWVDTGSGPGRTFWVPDPESRPDRA
ncbi:hypothetical protein GCM10010168_03800 [Actinoplanes ianthinogenes]|uniref:Uncharacterized protein n=1 Tax=Actinoplanes ianthinogenes TaxID=122358 RepID=A0ABM7LUN4_9ACTN|nr:hypothetical protein Aiant_35370 [Actinoplanes ianthinogenes]GGQ91618.1 hypothetical protein GCM10010168_03800 [Actinoplanes ianthinogenes]